MPGYGFGYGYGAVGFARRNPRLGGATPTPTPSTGPSLPAQANIVGHFNSSAISPQSDNSALAQWDDTSGSGAHATQATAASQPKYRAAAGAGINGQPYVQCDGVDDFLSIVTPGALATALDSRDYTIMVVVDNVTDGAGGYGNIFGATAGGDGLTVSATATISGQASLSVRGRILDPSGTGYRSFGIGSASTNDFGGSGGANLRRYFYRGTIFGSAGSQGIAPGGKTIVIGSSSSGATFRFKGNIYRIIIWSKLLSPAEALQAETYFNWFYNQVHPAVTHGRFLHIDGDSRFAAVGASSALDAAVYHKVAQGLGFPPGTYSVYAVGGLSIQKCINKGAELDNVAQALTSLSPSMKHRLIYEEFFNSRTIGTSALTSQTTEYVAARRAGFPAAVKIVGCSPIDHADVNTPPASAWGTAIEANWASMGFDGIVKLWSESPLGGDSACPNSAPYTPWSDGLHLADEGQAIQAAKIVLDAATVAGW